jgi:hypothetical protein
MTSLTRALWALGGAGVALGLADLALIVSNDDLSHRALWAAAA